MKRYLIQVFLTVILSLPLMAIMDLNLSGEIKWIENLILSVVIALLFSRFKNEPQVD